MHTTTQQATPLLEERSIAIVAQLMRNCVILRANKERLHPGFLTNRVAARHACPTSLVCSTGCLPVV